MSASMAVVAETGISYRQLDYWLRMGFIDGQRDTGTGSARDWTPEQVRLIRLMGKLTSGGIAPRRAAGLCPLLLSDGRAELAPGVWLTAGEVTG